MEYLVVAVVFVGALALVNLLLSLAIVRRLRRQAGQAAPTTSSRVTLARGTKAPEVSMTTVDGVTWSAPDLRGKQLTFAFFAASCQPCHAVLPDFVELARKAVGGPERVFAIVDGNDSAADRFIDELRGIAQVVTEPELGEVSRAFSVTAFPTFYQIDEQGRIAAGGPTVRGLALQFA